MSGPTSPPKPPSHTPGDRVLVAIEATVVAYYARGYPGPSSGPTLSVEVRVPGGATVELLVPTSAVLRSAPGGTP